MTCFGALAVWVPRAAVLLALLGQVATATTVAEVQPAASSVTRIVRVGPAREMQSLGVAARLAQDGDTIEVDAGDYRGDVAVWTADRLTIRAVGGRARLLADGRSAEGKAIWVVRGGLVQVENFDFAGARVADRNGAGIRFERGRLSIRNCRFTDNENGLLAGNDPDAELEISDSEFADNGAGDGRSHNLYVGTIRRLRVSGSHFHHARVGHLLKSRAAESFIAYNRLADGVDGRASYELEFPNGGIAHVIGNLIQQGAHSENATIVAFGAEGYRWPRNELYLSHNTIVDDRWPPGRVLAVRAGKREVLAVNNLLVGGRSLQATAPASLRNNLRANPAEFVGADRLDYRLRPTSRLLGLAVAPGDGGGVSLLPRQEYVEPRQTRVLGKSGARHPGALQSLGQAM